jgi:ankyrin repeat protein
MKMKMESDTNPLTQAINEDDPKSIDKILDKNPNLMREFAAPGVLPQFYAAGVNSVRALNALISRGADPRAISKSGNHLLHFAAIHGGVQIETCSFVLKMCPDLLNKPNKNGDTPLQCALVAGNWNAASFLINENASVLPKNVHDMRAAHCLCIAKPPVFMKPMIPKLNVNNRIAPGTFKEGMIKMERWKLLRKILKPVISEITLDDKELDMVTIFILKEYTNENQERFVWDPNWRLAQVFKLRLEIRMRQRAALLKRILTSYPSAVNERDRQGNTPLHLATLHSAGMTTIETLLKFGSDIRARNNRKRTCIQICTENAQKIQRKNSKGMTVSEFYFQSTQRALMIAWGNLETQARAAAESLLLNSHHHPKGKNRNLKKKKNKKRQNNTKKKISPSSVIERSSSESTNSIDDEYDIMLPEGDESEVFDALSVINLESHTKRLMARDIGVERANDLIYLDDEVLCSIGMKESDRKSLLDFADTKSGQLSDWLRRRRMETRLNSRFNNENQQDTTNDDVGGWTTYRRKNRHRGERKLFGARVLGTSSSSSSSSSSSTRTSSTIAKTKKQKDEIKARKAWSLKIKHNSSSGIHVKTKKSVNEIKKKKVEKKKETKNKSFANVLIGQEKKKETMTMAAKPAADIAESVTTTKTTTPSVQDLKSYINSSNVRLAAVDIEPSHVVGMDLTSLSIAQLEMLEQFHLNQVSKIMEQKVLKTQFLEKSKREEFERLQKQIRQLSSFTTPHNDGSLI